ncbi:MAG: DNA alkylation repair protein [Candidatus Heimdallarchaeota archaeon]
MTDYREKIAAEILRVKAVLRENAESQKLDEFLKFVPGAQNALAVRTPVIDDVVSSIWKERPQNDERYIVAACEALWTADSYYEERKVAIRLLEKLVKNNSESVMNLVNQWKEDIHTWDLCDQMGMRCSGNCLALSFEFYMPDIQYWSQRSELWVRRLGIVSLVKLRNQLLTKEQWDEIMEIFNVVWDDNRHYIKKGLAWSLRELSKLNPILVSEFLESQIRESSLNKSFGLQFLRESVKKLDMKTQERLVGLFRQN